MNCVFPTVADLGVLLPAIADFLRAIAWPIVIAALIYLFRSSIRGAFERLVEISPTGARMAPPAQQQAEGATPADAKGLKLPAGELPLDDPLARDPTLKHWRDYVEAQVAALGQMDEQSVRSRLMSAVAWQYRLSFFYNTLRMIYGSQIELISRLKAQVVTVKEAREIYETLHVERSRGVAPVPFERWMAFLVYNKLVFPSPHTPLWNDDDVLAVTFDGQEFAKFLLDAGETAQTKWY